MKAGDIGAYDGGAGFIPAGISPALTTGTVPGSVGIAPGGSIMPGGAAAGRYDTGGRAAGTAANGGSPGCCARATDPPRHSPASARACSFFHHPAMISLRV